jgi:hypothetical protein
MDKLEEMLAEQIQKALNTALAAQKPAAETVDVKAEIAAAVEAVKAELPALVKAAVVETTDREGVGRKGTMGDNISGPTLESDPVNFLLAKAKTVKTVDDWSQEEKAVIAGITVQYMLKGMLGSDDDED